MSSTTDRPWPRRLWGGIGAVLTAVVLAACVNPSLAAILQMTWLAGGREPEQIQRTLGDPQDAIWYTGEALQMTFSGQDRDGMELTENLYRVPGDPFTEVTQLDGATAVTTRCGQDCGTLADQELLLPRGSNLHVASADGMYYSVQGDVDVRTFRADVSGSSLSGEEISVRAGEGEVDLTHTALPASLEVRTGRGDISITLPAQEDPRRCTVETEASGEVDVDLGEGAADREDDAEVSCRIALHTGDGDITVTSAPPTPWERD